MCPSKRPSLLGINGPGLLIAATGVGAGDLATASITGSQLGVAVLWALLVGAGLWWVLNEGLARWQIATDQTLLEGAIAHLGRGVGDLFLACPVPWSMGGPGPRWAMKPSGSACPAWQWSPSAP